MSRNAIMRGLWDADPDDLILLSDVDEIPRGRTVRLLRHCAGIPTETGVCHVVMMLVHCQYSCL